MILLLQRTRFQQPKNDNKYKIYSKVSGVKHQSNKKTVSLSHNYSGLNVIASPQHWQFNVLALGTFSLL